MKFMLKNLYVIIYPLVFFLLCFMKPINVNAQAEHFNLLGKWCIEGEAFGLTPYCFEITMDDYGRMFAKLPATYSLKRKVVTQWQTTRVYPHNDKSGYYFEPANTRQEASYGVNFKTVEGSNDYRSICTLINYDVGKETLTAWVAYKYGSMLDRVYEVGDVTFIKEEDVPLPNLVDNMQTRKKGDAGLVADAVDLGLSVKWASWNLGASKPEDYGGYYAWGEIEEKDVYNWNNYKYVNNQIENDYWDDNNNEWVYKYQQIGQKINSEERFAEVSICGTEYDAAHVLWKNGWRMPTLEEISELENKCKIEGTTLNGVKGLYFIGPNGNRIFLPSAGMRNDDHVVWDMKDWRGAASLCWSGDLVTYYYLLGVQYNKDDGHAAWSIGFDSNCVSLGKISTRCDGLTIRPVMNY